MQRAVCLLWSRRTAFGINLNREVQINLLGSGQKSSPPCCYQNCCKRWWGKKPSFELLLNPSFTPSPRVICPLTFLSCLNLNLDVIFPHFPSLDLDQTFPSFLDSGLTLSVLCPFTLLPLHSCVLVPLHASTVHALTPLVPLCQKNLKVKTVQSSLSYVLIPCRN